MMSETTTDEVREVIYLLRETADRLENDESVLQSASHTQAYGDGICELKIKWWNRD